MMQLQLNPLVVPRVRTGAKRLIFTLSAAVCLLALGVPAALAATQPAIVPSAAALVMTTSKQPVAGQLNPYTARSYALGGSYSGCVFSAGDRYEGPGGAAVGMATISCPSPHTYRILVYLDYHDYANGREYTYRENVSGSAYYNYGASAWTGCAASVSAYWTTYAKISIDGSPYSGFFKSDSNQFYAAGSSCP
jgi:hypothetical protein